MTTTQLDTAHARMDQSDAARLHFYATFADAEVHVLLDQDPVGDDISPRVVAVEGEEVVLAFDTEARMADFAQGVAPFVTLPGRVLVQMLEGQPLGIGLNLDVAPSSMVLPQSAVTWLADTLDQNRPTSEDAQLSEVRRPSQVPEILLETLGAKLTSAAGLAQFAVLVEADFAQGGSGHVLVIVGAPPRAEPALARAVSEAVTFSGIDAGHLDVTFLRAGHPLVPTLTKVGLRFDVPQPQPQPQEPKIPEPKAPGSDPKKPPRLR